MRGRIAHKELDFLLSHEVEDARVEYLQLEEEMGKGGGRIKFEVGEDHEEVDQRTPRIDS